MARTTGGATGKAKIEIPDEGIDARVVERQGSRTLTYEAKVTNDTETNNDTESADELLNGADLDFVEAVEAEKIPKSKLELFFDKIRYAVLTEQADDIFYAYVTRLPDGIGSRNNVPCSLITELGMFQFTSGDIFNFSPELQKLNGNSGGTFNVKAFTLNGIPATVRMSIHAAHREGIEQEIGLKNYTVPNPIVQPINTTERPQYQPNPNEPPSWFRDYAARNDKILEQLTKPKEQSALEKALEAKVINDLVNPPQPQNNGGNFEEKMLQIFMMPQMVDKMASRMFREEKAEKDPTWIDNAKEVLALPVVGNALERVSDLVEAAMVTRMQNQTAAAQAAATAAQNGATAPAQPAAPVEETEEETMIRELVAELESDRPLDADNEFIKELREDFPDQAEQLKQAVKIMDFNQTIQLLQSMTQKMNPHPFIPFVDLDASAKEQKMVWNERGERLLVRFKEFYDFVKAQA